LCKTCPRRAKKKEFERSTIREWELWLKPKDLKTVDFVSVFECLKTILTIKDASPEQMTAKTSILVNVYESEKARYDKMTRDNA